MSHMVKIALHHSMYLSHGTAVITFVCDRCMLCCFGVYSAACLIVKLRCCIENNPIRVWETVIPSNPTTAMKNRDHLSSESDRQRCANTDKDVHDFTIS